MYLADRIEPSLYGGRGLGRPLIFKKAAHGFDGGGEGRVYPVLHAPVFESLDIGAVTTHCCWCIGAIEALEFGAPIGG